VGEEAKGAIAVGGSTAAVLDRPDAYLSRDQRRVLRSGDVLPDRVTGAALFADISGFTPLTEALAAELGPQRGAEELTANLNRVFHAIIDVLHEYGGDVIYFSGDAITCWLDGDDGARAAACGLAMQDAMDGVGTVRTPGGMDVQLGMKIAIAVGTARRFVVGDPDIQLIEVLAGRLIDDLAAAEALAERGEVLLEESALESLGSRVETTERRRDEETGTTVAVLASAETVAHVMQVSEPEAPLAEELVRPWLLPVVYERMQTGRGEFLAELRIAIPVFVRFTGIDYDADDDAIAKLDDFVRGVQRVLAEHGGNLLQLTLGDKGAYLYAVFGSPQAHEDDAARAAAAAIQIRELEGVTAAREIQVGVARGRLRSGTYGHDLRRTFVCLGDAVNLAARLMSKAPPGQIYVTDAVQELAGPSFVWERLPEMAVKGKAAAVTVHGLRGLASRAPRREARYELPLVGRQAEIDALEEAFASASEGNGRVVGVSAEAGLGKSRVVAEFVRRARRRGYLVPFGECQAYGSTSYRVWREIWRRLLGIDEELPEAEQVASLERSLEDIDPTLAARAPLLDALLGISIPDSELTRSLDAELRKTSLEALLADCLRARAAEEPLVLVLEDCHWIDALSRDLLEVLARAVPPLRVLILLAYRPAREPGGELGIERLAHFSELSLPDFEREEAEQLIGTRLQPLLGSDAEVPEALTELVVGRAEGNPFYIEELLNYIQAQGVDIADESALSRLELPESLHSLILSRVDTLSEAPRRTLKVASVVGRSFFAPALPGIYPELGSLAEVRGHLGTLGMLDLVRLDREDDEAYIFKHVVTQQVTYESMPFAIRSDLHERVGGYIEETEPDAVERNLDLLAHHYWHSENVEKKRDYLVRAGEAAKATFANAAATDYFQRAIPLLEATERWQVTRSLGAVLELIGDWAGAERSYRDALALTEESGDASAAGWTETSLAELARKRGAFDEATEWLDAAERHFEDVEDRQGFGRVLHIRGVVANIRGERAEARRHMEASLELRREGGDKVAMGALYSNLAIVAEYEGDYERSCALNEEGLALRRDAGDTAGIAISEMNLGVMLQRLGRLDEARARQEESLELRRQIGDPRMIALGEHNLGILTRVQGDYFATRTLFASALRVQRDQSDRWALAFMLEDVAVLATLLGEPELALRLAGAGAALRDEMRSPHGVAAQEELDAQLEPARTALGDRADEVWAEGESLGVDEAIRQALMFCEARDTSRPIANL
jgi:class 3 adenylate cyclase/tetratricopeptide (TPR) repeat protein